MRRLAGMVITATVLGMAAVAAPAHAQTTTPPAFGACTDADAERVWRGSDFPQRIEAEYGETFTPAVETFGVYRTFCRDLNGDGARDMIVLLAGPTVSSPTPWAIFDAAGGGVPAVAFAEIKDASYIDLTVRGDAYPDIDIRVRQKFFEGSEPNCCPQGVRYRYVRWDAATSQYVYGERRPPGGTTPPGGEYPGAPAPSGEPGCEGTVTAGPVTLQAACFRRQEDGTYEASGRARLNGIDIAPSEAGIKLVFDPRRLELKSTGTVTVQVGSVKLYEGKLDKSLRATFTVGIPAGAALKGFPVNGEARITLRSDGAEIDVNVGLAALGGVSGAATLQANQENGLRLDALSLTVPQASVKAVPLRDISLMYTRTPGGQDRWEGGATIGLPGPRIASISGRAAFLDGRFAEASGELTGNVSVAPGVFLTAIRARLVLEPEFGFGGGLSLSAGPRILGVSAASINGDFFFQSGTPSTFTVSGDINLVKFQLSQGSLAYRTDGRIDFSGDINLTLASVGFTGRIGGWIDGLRAFNATGSGTVGFKGRGLSGNGVVSSRGAAACGDLGLFSAGFGVRWEDFPTPKILAPSCDVGDFSEARAAQAGSPLAPGATQVVRVRRGTRGIVVSATGVGGAPAVSLRSPAGEVIAPPEVESIVDGAAGRVAFRNPDDATTYFAVNAPVAGDWTLVVEPGSVPVVQVRRANALVPTRVRARVRSGRGGVRTLAFTATRRSGQVIDFVERGPGIERRIATTSRSRGTIRFRPSEGVPGVRTIEAVVSRGGLPQRSSVVTRFRAGRATVGRVRSVRVRRTRRSARVVWRGATGAAAYRVRVDLSDGRRLMFTVGARTRTLAVPGVQRRLRVVATVRGLTRGGTGGKSARTTSRGR